MRCAKCDAWYPAEGAPRVSGPPPGLARPKLDEVKPKFAWEVWLMVLLLAVNVTVYATHKSWFYTAINAVMLVDLFKREAWGWWLTTILAGFGFVVCRCSWTRASLANSRPSSRLQPS